MPFPASSPRLLALAALAGSLCLGCAARGPVAPAVALRVMSYNIKHGRGMDDVVDLERAAAVIRRVRPDVVTLQEVDVGCLRSGSVDEAQRLGALSGMHAVFGRFMDYDGGEYGMALLSRHPILSWTNHILPPGEEPRSAVAARIRLPDGGPEVVVVGIHFYRTEEERLAQARALARILADETAPVVLAGDFNSQPDSPVMRFLEETWTNVPKGSDRFTFPSNGPDIEIDHILVRPASRFDVLRLEVLDEPVVSDHRPLYTDFAVR